MTEAVEQLSSAEDAPMVRDDILARVRGTSIRRSDVFAHLKLKGAVRGAILELIEWEVVRIRAADHGISPDETELTRYLERRRAIAGLSDPVRFQTWLRQNGVSYEQWNTSARITWMREKLAEKHTEKIEQLEKKVNTWNMTNTLAAIGAFITALFIKGS